MIAVREHFVLVRQVRAATVYEINARQAVLLSNLLRAEVFLHRHRIVGAAFDGRIVTDDHHLAAFNPANAGDHPCAWRSSVIHAMRCCRANL